MIEFQTAPALIIIGSFGLGAIFGSFLNVVIHRGPRLWGLVDGPSRGGLAGPGSYCPVCQTPIPWFRLVPVLSYIAQKGRCAACGAVISARYPAVETLGALIAVAAVLAFGASWAALGAAVFGWSLIALAFIDLETGYLPDAITYPLVAAGLSANALGLFTDLQNAAIGAVAGFAAFWLIGAAFEKIRGKEGLGLGDAKLLAAIGAWGGWVILPLVVLIGASATLGAVVIHRMLGNKTAINDPIPFGPGLCAAGFLSILFMPNFISTP